MVSNIQDTSIKERIELKIGNIVEVEAEAIVNAANRELILGGGVAGAIRKAGGDSIQEECNRLGPIPLGESVVTSAGKLKAKYIIHAASMSLGTWTTTNSLTKAVKSSLRRAIELKVKTIAYPAIGTGAAAYPVHRCAKVMLSIFKEHLQKYSIPEKIYIILYDQKSYDTFQEVYNNLFLPNQVQSTQNFINFP